mmetsp:Transcript_27981/g.59215  ORF Transcript_27981/g.59215 Transcript_27981/m.59215 type:complete len:526 (-) Transcript_27981:121-1698(-)|eukprot:CAMPEP_0171342412 /NCGR_PEP_ID=MMETSP0878-20121228/14236_1 /TAXON_ID=67004 /ORGANISM="Thalassiosira weissflogii, Strain CCMP1336" /LENGTH=525 /DNA_ID=CAMNT_0011845067 /DNA_START=49 /DNA_END=1626 /DNA_ORIENTATION=+
MATSVSSLPQPSGPNSSAKSTKRRSLSPTPSNHSNSSTSSSAGNKGEKSGTRNFSASQAAATSAVIAAAVDATCANRAILPGLAELFLAPGGLGSAGVGVLTVPFAAGRGSDPDISSGEKSDAVNLIGSVSNSSSAEVRHPSLPSVEAVTNAAKKAINDFPPYITLSIRDSAPQLKLENPPPIPSKERDKSDGTVKLQRKLVARGGIKGYRMSRATHGVSKGCYYYEAVIMGSPTADQPNNSRHNKKRALEMESVDDQSASKRQRTSTLSFSGKMNGHIRVGWSTRLGDLQAPVGYDKHSFAIRDIAGSRVHNSRREDLWGGQEFGPGDVMGFAISLLGDTAANETGKASETNPTNSSKNEGLSDACSNCIFFFKNGELLGKVDGRAFDRIAPDKYFPAISCYEESSARLNFGPHFVFPPASLPCGIESQPLSNLCPPPPTPDDAVDMILSGSKEGKKIFFSKRTDESIVNAFKDLVKAEAVVRHEAFSQHLCLHLKEIRFLREERGLDTFDVVKCKDEPTDGVI